MARRKSKNGSSLIERLAIVVLVLALGAAFYINYLAERVRAESGVSGEFDVLGGARFVPHRGNDGDSFHIGHGGEEYVFRLYYVDCPETNAHRYQQRLEDQGEYFGGLEKPVVVELGLEAKDYVEDLLRRHEFTIYTRWEEVYDSGRFYALVEVDGEFLSERLVQLGLARIHTKGVNLPSGRSFSKQRENLRAMEVQAREAKVGGWR